jgi:hypothetical protein
MPVFLFSSTRNLQISILENNSCKEFLSEL